MSKLHELAEAGQSIWYEGFRRACLTAGELSAWLPRGVRGLNSNPTVLAHTLAGSADYDADLQRLLPAKESLEEIHATLVREDAMRAADLLRPVYDATAGGDGYVCLDLDPALTHDTTAIIAAAQRLFGLLNRPNVMIKIPATAAGLPAIIELIAAGVNLNVTLIFNLQTYEQVAEAYLAGLEQRLGRGEPLNSVAAVASFHVGEIDDALAPLLAAKGQSALLNQLGIASARLAYAKFQEILQSPRWQKLAAAGAAAQRLLWSSTSMSHPLFPDTFYVENLIAPQTVCSVTPMTLTAFLEHGKLAPTLAFDAGEAKEQLAQLPSLGIDLNVIAQQLVQNSRQAFSEACRRLRESLADKLQQLSSGQTRHHFFLGKYESAVASALKDLHDHTVLTRIWQHDHTVWKPDPTEITNRLGWLHSPEVMHAAIPEISAFVDEVRAEGFSHALLLGMGGSSLAPEVFRFTLGVRPGFLDLAVLDSTDAEAVAAHAQRLNLAKTLFLVSTKSGGTVETFSFFKYFYNLTAQRVGSDKVGRHFIAITDPGSGLVDTARKYAFRKVFLNDPNIGGRYSALSCFGLVPAALLGVDLRLLLERGAIMACNSEGCNSPLEGDNLSAQLGAVLGQMAAAGRDKVTLLASPAIRHFGAWAEQLIAESTGKEGKGILPVDGEEVATPAAYGDDRVFVHLRLRDDRTHDSAIAALQQAGHPVLQFTWQDEYDLGGEFFRWEMATAVASRRLGINPFDQPDVESAKVLARQMVAAYQQSGHLPEPAPTLQAEGIAVYADFAAASLRAALQQFLAPAEKSGATGPRAYVALQAYLPPTAETEAALQQMRSRIMRRWRCATTVGYGPRFLHSTGQLHKGDAGNGLFIQFTSDPRQEVPIPDEAGSAASAMTFGVLKLAQALGDQQALRNAGRHVIRFHLGTEVVQQLQRLADLLA